MKKGDKVKLVDIKGIEGYEIMKQLKKNGIYTIDYIKPSGGVVLQEINHPHNLFGTIQGLIQERFKVVNSQFQKKKKKKK